MSGDKNSGINVDDDMELQNLLHALERCTDDYLDSLKFYTMELERSKDMRRRIAKKLTELEKIQTECENARRKCNDELFSIRESSKRAQRAIRKIQEFSTTNLPTVEFPEARRTRRIILESVNMAASVVRDYKKSCGVYFLLDHQEIVYVGQSVNVHARVSQHLDDSTKSFNRVCYLPARPEELSEIENAMIVLLKPKFNTRGNPASQKRAITPLFASAIVSPDSQFENRNHE